ncbi:hypothetical protein [Streptomyces sp. RB17]|uniref:hypothetical protein n=1 Tax=Streptomyces sp. RB17 TaxID=2585197 RepID=UPI0018865AC8|nr:hypothetical protein [Streptomyces sp. RB17]
MSNLHRTEAFAGRLAVGTPWHKRRVRTDALVSVRQYDGVSCHLVLRDTHGHRLELDTGVRRSLERGTLPRGADVVYRLGHRIDDETVRAVLRASGLS